MTLTQARVAWLNKEFREAVAEDATVQTAHLLAPQIVEDSCLVSETDAQAEATRRQTLRGVKRDRLEITVELNDETDELDLGDVITLTHSRYGLAAGKQFRVLGVQPNAAEHAVTLTLWG
jgi:hypothetical protein